MIPKRDSNIMLVKAAENLHENSHLLLWNHEEFPKIYSGRFKWVYLWRCGQGWVFEENQCYKQTFLVFFFFLKNHPTFPDSGHMPFPLCVGMEVTGGSVTMGRWKPKVRPLRKIKLNLTSKADG